MNTASCDLCGKEFGTDDGRITLCRVCYDRGLLWASIRAYKAVSGVGRNEIIDKFEKQVSGEKGE